MISALIVSVALAKKPPPPPPAPVYEDVIAELIGQAVTQDAAWNDLVTLTTTIGPRPNGSAALDRASEWGKERMTAWGLSNVHTEAATLKTWSRGTLTITAQSPYPHTFDALSLGGSVGTPPEGIDADVIVVSHWDEFAALPDDEVKGRIVVWNVPFTDYGETVGYRFAGASVASKRGAVASLVRSVAPTSLDTPHTGAQKYIDGAAPIPAIAITIEDATWLALLQTQGITPRLHLASTAAPGPDAVSHNVIGEVKGREKPDEIVLLGCHLDSWDVGQGAQDDGAGCVHAMTAVGLIARQPVPPRRTVRVVLFVGEEYGGVGGGNAYAEAHAAPGSAEKHVAVMESDIGAGPTLGFQVDVRVPEGDDAAHAAAVARVIQQISPVPTVLAGLGMGKFEAGHSGTDVDPLVERGALGFGLWQDTTGYWPIHHTRADTIDKIDPNVLDGGVTAMAVLAWTLADAPSAETP